MPPTIPVAPRPLERLAYLSSGTPEAEAARERLVTLYGECPIGEADVVVALGGDGLMIQTLHKLMGRNVPVFGMNRGSVGFLMNDFRDDALIERLAAATSSVVHPLVMRVTTNDGETHEARAINEVSMLRQTHQAAKLRIAIDTGDPGMQNAEKYYARGGIIPLQGRSLVLLRQIRRT